MLANNLNVKYSLFMYNRTWIFMYWSGLGNAHNYTFGIQFFFIPKTTCAPSHAEIMVLSLSSTPYQNFSLLRLTSWSKSKIKKSHSDSHLKFCVIATLHKLFEARFLNQDAFGQLAVKAAEKFTDELSGNKWHWFRQVKEKCAHRVPRCGRLEPVNRPNQKHFQSKLIW